MYVCMYACMYLYVYTHIHAYTYIHYCVINFDLIRSLFIIFNSLVCDFVLYLCMCCTHTRELDIMPGFDGA